MARYIIQSEETKGVKNSIKKWGEIPVRSEHIDGVLTIKNYRKYKFNEEIDVDFEGKIFVRIGYEKRKWQTNSILQKHNISKVKLNRFLRKSALFELQIRMKYFGVSIREYYDIKKIKWK
jgi:hypothetical protein